MKTFPLYFVLNMASLFSLSAQKKIAPLISNNDSGLTIELSPIPVVKDNKIALQWKCSGHEKNSFCIIERSSDEINFDMIGVIRASSAQFSFEFTDEKPAKEKNYYRIKMAGPKGEDIFSQTISVDKYGSFFCKFYPNPVDKLLIVRTDYNVSLQITDMDNKTRINQQLRPGLQIVDVSSLEKGIYILVISRHNTNKVITEKLIKN